IANALLLVGVRFAEPPDVRRHLPDELTIDAGHRDVRLLVDRDVDPLRDVEHDRVRVAEREHHLLALQLGAIADADDVELALEACGHAEDGVGDEAARQTVELAKLRIFGRGLRHDVTVGHLEADAVRVSLPKLALRALNLDGAVNDLDGHAFRDRDWFFSNSRHFLSTRYCRALRRRRPPSRPPFPS